MTNRNHIRPFNWCQNQRPWVTLNGRYALYCTKHASFGAHYENLILSAAKYSPITLVSGNIRFIRTFAGVSYEEWASNDSAVVDNGSFQFFSLAMSSETLEIRPALLYSDWESPVGFSLIPKYMILNDTEWLFHVKYCFRAGRPTSGGRDCTFRK